MVEISIPDSITKSTLADWVEMYVASNNNSMSKAEFSTYLEHASADEVERTLIDDVWTELERRERLYGENSPIKVTGRIIEASQEWTENPGYMMMLILSIMGNSKNVNYTGKLFERVCSIAIKKYLQGETVVYGYGSSMNAQLLAEKIEEKVGMATHPDSNDDGLDVVGWKSFGDNRTGKIVLLVQCASGKNWKHKLGELSLTKWKNYIHFGCEPLKGFSLTEIIEQSKLIYISFDAGIVFDRGRLVKYLSFEESQPLKEEVLTWCRTTVAGL